MKYSNSIVAAAADTASLEFIGDIVDDHQEEEYANGSAEVADSSLEDDEEQQQSSSVFEKKYEIADEEAVSLQSVYVLHVDAIFPAAAASSSSSVTVVAALSDYRVVVYDVAANFRQTFSNEAHSDVVTGVKFFSDDGRQLLSGSLDGAVKLWDTRTGGAAEGRPALVFKDDSDGVHKTKPINCFDVSCDRRFVCGGTPLVEADAYLLFWDARKSSVLGGYWEAHTDDVTQVCFDPVRGDRMLSGSTDGLVNAFDVSRGSEEDALLNSLNADTAVRKLRWLPDPAGTAANEQRRCGCITDMETLQLWNADEAELLRTFDRRTVGQAINERSSSWDDVYVCDVYATSSANEEMLVLCGSGAGKGDRLRLAKMESSGGGGSDDGGQLRAYASFEGNKQLVRCGCYDPSHDMFITGGESGIISVWRASQQQLQQQDTDSQKIRLKERVRRNKNKRN